MRGKLTLNKFKIQVETPSDPTDESVAMRCSMRVRNASEH